MTDAHIHLEGREYTVERLEKFVRRAEETHMDEIWLLEHSYYFREFAPMYGCILGKNRFTDDWFSRKCGGKELSRYLALVGEARRRSFPVKLRFGLEVCYFEGAEEFVRRTARGVWGLIFSSEASILSTGLRSTTRPNCGRASMSIKHTSAILSRPSALPKAAFLTG